MNDIQEQLKQGLEDLKIDYSPRQLASLETYLQELLLWNRRLNLVGRGDSDPVARHLLDSLSALSCFSEVLSPEARIADVGSGAGLPGIPLGLFLPRVELLLIERSGRRAGFLRNAVLAAGLGSRTEVIEADAAGVKRRVDALTMRAFRALPDALPLVEHLIVPGGYLFDYHGRRETIEEELSHPAVQGWDWEILPLKPGPEGEERHLLRGRRKEAV